MKTKTITIHINLDNLGIRLLLLAILVTSLGGSIAFAQDGNSPANALTLDGPSARKYYLTISGTDGDGVLTACAAGYHAATVWEILDVSNLVYDTVLGYKHVAGDGTPPTNVWGWVRTGGIPSIGPGAGGGNCGVWSQFFALTYGTLIKLPGDWSAPGSTIGVWATSFAECTNSFKVWCVED
jgi:hypothetical protein